MQMLIESVAYVFFYYADSAKRTLAPMERCNSATAAARAAALAAEAAALAAATCS